MVISGSQVENGDGGWAAEFRQGKRFGFGRNWAAFLRVVDEQRISSAQESIKTMLGLDRLQGRTFLDAGSGSGLFSLAARRLGAAVTSFDYDPQSVSCTAELRERFSPGDDDWQVEQGSVLDTQFLSRLGLFDIVYCWGVLHHTGAMWPSLDNICARVAPGGHLWVAIYNDQGRTSTIWKYVKKAYVRAPSPLKWFVLIPALIRLWGPTVVRDLVRGKGLKSWRDYDQQHEARGMHPWRDVVDWVGGYPFEVARPECVIQFCSKREFEIVRTRTCGSGPGCNEFLFVRASGR